MPAIDTVSEPAAGARPARRPPRSERSGLTGAPVASKIGFALLMLLLGSALIAPLLPLQDPLAQSLSSRNAGPSIHHLLGTDLDGRDVLARTIYGGQSAFEGVGVGLLVALVAGIPWGLIAGFGSTWLDETLMRLADAVLSFPAILLALGVVSALGPSLIHSMITVGLISAPVIGRLLRSAILPVKRAEYVLVAHSLGVTSVRVAIRHVLPNAMGPVVVQGFALGSFLVVEAALSFLGFGIQPPAPNWGGDLASAYLYFTSNPFGTVVLGVIITLGAWSISSVGDYVRGRMVAP